MNEWGLSATTRQLLLAAKGDVPSTAARAKMWAGVSGAVGEGAAGVAASSLMGGSAGVTKMVTLGALFGSTLTVGLAATLLHIGSVRMPPVPIQSSPSFGQAAGLSVRVDGAVLPPPPTERAAPAVAALSTPTPTANRLPTRSAKPAKPAFHEDALAREASLVTQGRAALVRGDPRAALRAVRVARALPAHQLDPEELAVEEQALRALGRSDQANGIEVQLRLQYPEMDLAR